jgi:hypothetical protein
MKYLNIIITVCFMILFAVIFYNTEHLLTSEVPQMKGIDDNLLRKMLSDKFVFIVEVKENEYTKTAIGAAIGYVVKEICAFLLNLAKKLYRKISWTGQKKIEKPEELC